MLSVPARLQAAVALRVATRVVEVEFLAQEIGQLGPVDELAAVIQKPGDIRNGRRLRQRPLDLVLCNHADTVCAKPGTLFSTIYGSRAGLESLGCLTVLGVLAGNDIVCLGGRVSRSVACTLSFPGG